MLFMIVLQVINMIGVYLQVSQECLLNTHEYVINAFP